MNELIIAEKILRALESRYFADWYEGKFMDYVEGADDAPSKEEILEWIVDNVL